MEIKQISIASDFSRYPAGRFYADGPFPGEKFREEILYPALSSADTVVVDLKDTLGFGSSFLEEAFGGLVRKHKMTAAELKVKLKVQGGPATYAKRIWKYIEDADRLRQ